jgi:hypothetical protein
VTATTSDVQAVTASRVAVTVGVGVGVAVRVGDIDGEDVGVPATDSGIPDGFANTSRFGDEGYAGRPPMIPAVACATKNEVTSATVCAPATHQEPH